MSAQHRRIVTVVALSSAAVLALPMAMAGAAPATTAVGPSTATAPYLLPVADDVHLTSLLTVDDAGAASNGYELVGIPDGLGAIRQGSNVVTFMNHELPATSGIVRAHGQKGAFVSRHVINSSTGEVKESSDWIQPGAVLGLPDQLIRRSSQRGRHPSRRRRFPAYLAAFGRFCSGYLTEPSELFNETTKPDSRDSCTTPTRRPATRAVSSR